MQKSLGLIETQGLAGGITAADAAVKSANVRLIGYELTKGGGWTTVKIEGDVGAVKAAVDAAKVAAGKMCRVVSTKVIPRPAGPLDQLVFSGDTVGYEPPEPPKEDPPAPPEPPQGPDESPKEEAAPPPEPDPVTPEPEPVAEAAELEPEAPAEAESGPEPEAPAEKPAAEPEAEQAPEAPAVEPAPEAEAPAEESKPKAAKKAPAKRGKRKQ